MTTLEKLCKANGPQSSTSARWISIELAKPAFDESIWEVAALNSKEIVIFGVEEECGKAGIWIFNSKKDSLE